jgi:hypothetical protein
MVPIWLMGIRCEESYRRRELVDPRWALGIQYNTAVAIAIAHEEVLLTSHYDQITGTAQYVGMRHVGYSMHE